MPLRSFHRPGAEPGAGFEYRLTVALALAAVTLFGVLVVRLLLPWLLVVGLIGLALWGWQRRRTRELALHQIFYAQIAAHQGRISVLDFAIAAQITGSEARQFLDQRAKDFWGDFEPTAAGDVLYTFCSWSQTAVDPQAAAFLPAAESLNATIRGDRVAGGIVVNPADIPTQNLPPQARQALETAFSTIPMLGDRPLYIGIEGSPRVDNGRLVLGNDTRVQIGRVNLSLEDVSRLTGISPAQLNERINLALPQAGLTLDGLEFINGEAVLRGVTQ